MAETWKPSVHQQAAIGLKKAFQENKTLQFHRAMRPGAIVSLTCCQFAIVRAVRGSAFLFTHQYLFLFPEMNARIGSQKIREHDQKSLRGELLNVMYLNLINR